MGRGRRHPPHPTAPPADLAEEGRLGLCTGALSSASGLIVLLGSTVTGTLLDAHPPPAVPWPAPATVPLAAIGPLPRR